MHNGPSIGPRISIRSTTGSGMTTLGHSLGQRLSLPIVELDAIYWLPNWQGKPLDQFLPTCKRRWRPAPGVGSVSATTPTYKSWCSRKQTPSYGCGRPSVSPSGGSSSTPLLGR